MHGITINWLWFLRPRPDPNHSHLSDHYHAELPSLKYRYNPGPKIFTFLWARYEWILLRMVFMIIKYLPRSVVVKVLVPMLGLPIKAPSHQVFPTEEVLRLINYLEKLKVPLGIGVCICRYARRSYVSKGEGYNVTDLVIGYWGQQYIHHFKGSFREISYAEARIAIKKFANAGLVHTVFTACPGGDMQGVICNCDRKACVPMSFYNYSGVNSFHKAPYDLIYNKEKCNGCQNCVQRCPVNARQYLPKSKKIYVDQSKCIACGVCRDCNRQANSLVSNPTKSYFVMPPFTN